MYTFRRHSSLSPPLRGYIHIQSNPISRDVGLAQPKLARGSILYYYKAARLEHIIMGMYNTHTQYISREMIVIRHQLSSSSALNDREEKKRRNGCLDRTHLYIIALLL
jgi:hypothetical protein